MFHHFKIMKSIISLIFTFIFLSNSSCFADRIKDMASLAGVRSNQLVGYGLVIGLAKTGDGSVNLTKQSIAAMIAQFGVIADTADIDATNSANVMVTANLPPFAKPGQTIDVTVSTIGKAKSLKGGTLLMTGLKGADGQVYAIAQGNLVVGGLGVEGADGSTTIQGTPTVGRIPGGATVEKLVENTFLEKDNIVLNLHQADFSQANRIANTINETFGPEVAIPMDSTSIKVRTPANPSQKVSFIGLLENINFEPVTPKAKVVVNSRTGTVVISRAVKVTAAAVTHGQITVSVSATNEVSQPQAGTLVGGEAGETTPVTNAELAIQEEARPMFVFQPGVNLRDIVDAVNEVGATPSSLIAILDALKSSGSLRAELVVL